MNRSFLLILGVIMLSLFLRLWDIHKLPADIHWDITVTFYSMLYNHDFGYYWDAPMNVGMWRIASYIFGVNRFAVVIPTVLMGVISITSVYLIIRRLFDWEIALTSALLFSISAYHILFSRIGFFEMFMSGFLCMWMVYYFFMGMKMDTKYFLYFGFILGIALFNIFPPGIYVSFLYCISLVIVEMGYRKIFSRHFITGMVLAVCIYILCNILFAVLQNRGSLTVFLAEKSRFLWRMRASDGAGLGSVNLITLIHRFMGIWEYLFFKMSEGRHLGVFRVFNRPMIDPFVGTFFVIGLLHSLWKIKQNEGMKMLIVWLFVGVISFLFINPNERYLFVLLPIPYILCSVSLVKVFGWFKNRYLKTIGFGCFILCVFLYNWTSYFVVYRDTYSGGEGLGQKEIYTYLGGHYSSKDTVLLCESPPHILTYSSFYAYPNHYEIKGLKDFKDAEELLKFEKEQVENGKRIVYIFGPLKWQDVEPPIFKDAHPFLNPIFIVGPGLDDTYFKLYEVPAEGYIPINDGVQQINSTGDYFIYFFTKLDRFNRERKVVGKYCLKDVGREWDVSPNNVSYNLRFTHDNVLEVDIEFDGDDKEDEFVRISKALDIDLKDRYLGITHSIEDPEVQVIELILHLDVNGDGKSDGHIRELVRNTEFSEYIWSVYEQAKERFPDAEEIVAISLEIYPHKIWWTDCSGQKRGVYRFELGEIEFFRLKEYREMLKDFSPVEVRVNSERIVWEKMIKVQDDSIWIQFYKRLFLNGEDLIEVGIVDPKGLVSGNLSFSRADRFLRRTLMSLIER